MPWWRQWEDDPGALSPFEDGARVVSWGGDPVALTPIPAPAPVLFAPTPAPAPAALPTVAKLVEQFTTYTPRESFRAEFQGSAAIEGGKAGNLSLLDELVQSAGLTTDTAAGYSVSFDAPVSEGSRWYADTLIAPTGETVAQSAPRYDEPFKVSDLLTAAAVVWGGGLLASSIFGGAAASAAAQGAAATAAEATAGAWVGEGVASGVAAWDAAAAAAGLELAAPAALAVDGAAAAWAVPEVVAPAAVEATGGAWIGEAVASGVPAWDAAATAAGLDLFAPAALAVDAAPAVVEATGGAWVGEGMASGVPAWDAAATGAGLTLTTPAAPLLTLTPAQKKLLQRAGASLAKSLMKDEPAEPVRRPVEQGQSGEGGLIVAGLLLLAAIA